MSGIEQENIAMIDDSIRVSKIISRRFLVELYKKVKEAEFAGQSTSFRLDQIVNEVFRDEEKQVVFDYFQKHSEYFEGEFVKRDNNEGVALTPEGKLWISMFYAKFLT
jgi:hypothetical protein